MFAELLERLAAALEEQDLPYMLIGGQAVLLYGEARTTKGIDITLGVGIESLPLIMELAGKIRLRPLVNDPHAFVFQTAVLPLEDAEHGLRVDVIFSLSEYEKKALSRVKKVRIRNAEVCFISLEDLVIHKIFAGRPRDIEDARIVMIKTPAYDRAYIQHWLRLLGDAVDKDLVSVWQHVLDEAGL